MATTSESGGETGREPATALAGAPLRCGSLRSVPHQPNPQGKEQHQENSRSSLPFSFSPCSLIKSTKTVSKMLARRGKVKQLTVMITAASDYSASSRVDFRVRQHNHGVNPQCRAKSRNTRYQRISPRLSGPSQTMEDMLGASCASPNGTSGSLRGIVANYRASTQPAE
jgi:hypothetical protein